MKKIRIVLCDDNVEEMEHFESLIRETAREKEIPIEMKTYDSGDSLLFDLEDPVFTSKLDVLFLDIHMPGTNGMDVANLARSYGYEGIIVFLTISKTHFEEAFDVRAFNYITKGDNADKRLETILLRAMQEVRDTRKEIVVLSCGGVFKQVKIRDILYFEISKRIVTVHYGDNQTFSFVSTLEKLDNQLMDYGFQRIHRSYLISLAHTKKVVYGEVTLSNDTKLPVARQYNAALKEALKNLLI